MTASADAIAIGPEAADELKAYLRACGGEEDALVTGLAAAALSIGERFTGQALLRRRFVETIRASAAWTRLATTPVRAIESVAALPVTGEAVALGPGAYAVDIDAAGDGWIRILDAGGVGRVQVTLEAGIAASWNELPEGLRHGAVRLAAHLYTRRDSTDETPPAAVAALWRPWRRMRIA